MQASIVQCLSKPGQIVRVVAQTAWELKNGGILEVEAPIVRAGVQMDCSCACLCYLSMYHKIQKMASNNGQS